MLWIQNCKYKQLKQNGNTNHAVLSQVIDNLSQELNSTVHTITSWKSDCQNPITLSIVAKFLLNCQSQRHGIVMFQG